MPTVTKTWDFASDLMGFAKVGLCGMDFWWDGSSGSPVNGHMVIDDNFGPTEKFRTGAGVTWETWGVPPGSTVTAVQLTSWYYCIDVTGYNSCSIKMRVLNSSNTSVHSAGDLCNQSVMGVYEWTHRTNEISRNVDGSYQASSTAVKMEIECTETAVDWDYTHLDTIALTITYTGGGGGFTAKARRLLSQIAQRVGSRQAR